MREFQDFFRKNIHTEIGVINILVNSKNHIHVTDNQPIIINGVKYSNISLHAEKKDNGVGWQTSYFSMYRDNGQPPTAAAEKKLKEVALAAIELWHKYYLDEVREAHRIITNNEIHYKHLENTRLLLELQEIHDKIAAVNTEIAELENQAQQYELVEA